MKNQKSLQPPAKCGEHASCVEASIEDAMQQWLDNAQESHDIRDRIAVANGISRGVFGSFHLGESQSDYSCDDDFEEEFKRAA